MSNIQQIIFDITNAYKIDKIKLCDQYIQDIKDIAKNDKHAAQVLAVEKKLESALKTVPILIEVLQSHPINQVPDLDRLGIFYAIQEIDTQSIEYFDKQLIGVI